MIDLACHSDLHEFPGESCDTATVDNDAGRTSVRTWVTALREDALARHE